MVFQDRRTSLCVKIHSTNLTFDSRYTTTEVLGNLRVLYGEIIHRYLQNNVNLLYVSQRFHPHIKEYSQVQTLTSVIKMQLFQFELSYIKYYFRVATCPKTILAI